MKRFRHQKQKNLHFLVLVNKAASQYSPKAITKLTEAVKKKGGFYTIAEPDSAVSLLKQAHAAKTNPETARRGEVTGLVAAGGDGTFNLVARAAMELDLPVGILPLGRFNSVAKTYLPDSSVDHAIAKILSGDYRKIDCAMAADQPFFASIGFGLIPELLKQLDGRRTPRFSLGWGQIANKAAGAVEPISTVIKIDAFRFEISPLLLSVHLVPYALGLQMSSSSLPDDGRVEVIFDVKATPGDLANFIKTISKKKYLYGDSVRVYRGQQISISPTQGRTLYLDGELVPLPTSVLSITCGEKQVKLFC